MREIIVSRESKANGIVKSWFTLAEIFGVISGLFMIATGFLFVPPSEQPRIYLDSLELCNKILTSELNNVPDYNLSQCLNDYKNYFSGKIIAFNSYASFFFGMSFICIFNTLAFWRIGRKRITHDNYNDNRAFTITLVYDILLLIIAGFISHLI